MTKKILMLLFAFALVLVAAPRGSAQTTAPTEVMYHWGAIHKGPWQAVVLNFQLTDHIGSPITVPVEFRLEDNAGNVVYDNTVMVSSGRTFSIAFVVGPEYRVAQTTIQADIFAAIGPEIRTLAPCLKVVYPPGPGSPLDLPTPTLEVMNALTGQVQTFAADPHVVFGLGIPQ
ncbi:MAG: hypothetical protein DMG43_08350 [Acidobacteria bacterium]|nr:MAG: hypothetical protein DMG43_08350 [Acidobacteriota bacterium]